MRPALIEDRGGSKRRSNQQAQNRSNHRSSRWCGSGASTTGSSSR